MTVQADINETTGLLNRTINAIPKAYVGATFAEIKRDLMNFFGNQDEFKDYDFSGSRVNVFLDLLAYHGLFIQQFSSTATYESFLRTANLRAHVVQAAQDNSYLPASKSCASTGLMLKVSHSLNPTSIRIPRGTKFLAYAKNTSADPYPFVVTEDVVVVKDSNNQYVPIVNVSQGRIVRTQSLFDKTKQIIIRDDNVDRNTFRVYVDGAEWVNWTHKSMIHAGSTSSIFYLRETLDGNTEVYFGEGETSTSVAGGVLESNYIGGLKPSNGSSIVIEYITTQGESANGAVGFTYADTLQYITVDSIIENYTNDADYVGADGGGDVEDIERIRELAVVKRESQLRCVTPSDYNAFVSERFGSIVQAVNTYSVNDKPGYVFIPIKPKSGLYLTAVQRDDIENYLKEYKIAGFIPTVTSPDYLFIKSKINVTYEINKLQESEQWLKSKITDQIDRYYIEEVEVFNKSFAKSKMLSYIDNSDFSILGSSAELTLVREVSNYFQSPEVGISFNNTIVGGSSHSSEILFIGGKASEEEDRVYPVRILTTTPDEDSIGKVLLGPFRDGDVTETEYIQKYTNDDFDRSYDTDMYNVYYVIGNMSYYEDSMYWNISSIGLEESDFETQSIEVYSTPMDSNIYTTDGSLIVFENDLRPDYTEIVLEGIAR